MPLLKTRFDFKATQDLHGQSGPYPAGGSAQKWDEVWELGGIGSSTGSTTPDTDKIRSKNFCSCAPSTTYYFVIPSKNVSIYFYDANYEFISYEGWWNSSRTFTTPSNCQYFKIGGSSAYGTTYKNDISINYPSTDTSYHPYSNICPISGVSEINIYHRGANLFDISTKTDNKALKWTDGDTFNDAKSIVSNFIEVKEGIRFTSNYLAQWCCYDKDKNYLGNILSGNLIKTSGSDRVDNTIPSGYGVYYIRLGYRSSLNNNEDMTEKTDIMLNIGNTATDFEPYNGSTTLINLGGTYYGGYVTQDKSGKRELVVTHGYASYDLSKIPPNETTDGWDSWIIYRAERAENNPSSSVGKLCNCCPEYSYAGGQINRPHYYVSAGAFVMYLAENTYRDGQLEYIYPLETPFIVPLPDGQPIKSFAGINNIYADTGDTSLQFRKIG